MRKSIRGALRKTREHLGIEVPVLGLVLRSEDAPLGGSVESFLQLLGIDAPEKFLECGASGGQGGGILRLELTKVGAYLLNRSVAGRQGGHQTDQRFIHSL